MRYLTYLVVILALACSGAARANPDVLLIWDSMTGGTTALETALTGAGANVTLSTTSESSYDGTNPPLTGFHAVIHLNGSSYGSEMPAAGQIAISDFVHSGGGYIHGEWNAYQIGNGQMLTMQPLTLFDRNSGSEGALTIDLVPGMETHPVVANLPLSFSFQTGRNEGPAHVFASHPVEVLAVDNLGSDAVAVREWGDGRVVGFNLAPNYGSYNPLADANVQQLYIDAVFWVADIDEDLDGWSPMDGDCDDADPAIYPGAPETCDDGVDSNCDGVTDELLDNDGDGYSTCQLDCDDTDPTRFPGAVEICDHFDSDCDGDVDEGFDGDGDGWFLCDDPPDCDDIHADVYPGAPEVCNGFDDDCDGVIDEQTDDDSDGYTVCGGDCDDNDDTVFPGAPELCDELDNDCDGAVPADETTDADGDGWVECMECDDADAAINPDASELCDGIDNNCDGHVDEGLDGDGDAVSVCAGDCDDTDPTIYPGAPEICDGIDNDCDEELAEYEDDADGDGYMECEECDDTDSTVYPGASEICDDGIDSDCLEDLESTEEDNDSDGYSECSGDCDDDAASVNPGAEELCNQGVDDDCNPATSEIADTDLDGYTICQGDCDDFDAGVSPAGDEICDGKDNDCNGLVDDGIDYDFDGYSGCGDDTADCDDYNPNVFPGASEVPYDGVDQDCDGVDLTDVDGDGFDGGAYGDDCDDLDPEIHPEAVENCVNGVDDNCNGIADDYDDDCTGEEPVEGDDDDCSCDVDGEVRGGAAAVLVVLAGLLVIRRR